MSEASTTWTDWPTCPRCGLKRHTECDACGTAGANFALTERGWEDQTEVVRVICPTCDSAFVPQFRRVCHGCGFEFEPGPPLPPPPIDEYENVPRVWLMLGLLLSLGVAVAAYFGWLLRR